MRQGNIKETEKERKKDLKDTGNVLVRYHFDCLNGYLCLLLLSQ